MNSVQLMGRLTADPQTNHSQSGTAITSFMLAVDRRFKREGDEQTADFIRCVAFSKTADFISKYGRKGTKFVVEGRIQTGSYQKDGQTIYTTDVVVENAEFAESKKAAEGNTAPEQKPIVPAAKPATPDGFIFIPDGIDEELPFN